MTQFDDNDLFSSDDLNILYEKYCKSDKKSDKETSDDGKAAEPAVSEETAAAEEIAGAADENAEFSQDGSQYGADTFAESKDDSGIKFPESFSADDGFGKVDFDSDDFIGFDHGNYGTYELDDDDDDADEEDEKQDGKRSRKKRKSGIKLPVKIVFVLACLLTLLSTAYAVVVRGNIPFVVKWRNIWIETAMTTDQHKWLATSFFPKWLIDDVMGARVDVRDIGKTDLKKKNGEAEKPDEPEETDILGQKNLVVGELDSHGNEVLVNDLEQSIVILKVKTSNFVGRLVLIDDPSRVFIATTDNKEVRGKFICDYLADEDAIVGMNASGFHDPGGVGIGGVVTARTMSKGEYWGTYSSEYITVGFDRDDQLVVGEFSDWDAYNIRDAFQYHPALIINGDKVIEGASGWGLQPRTVIGQAKNGMVLFLVVDGRQVGYSLGATMGDCADILEEYGAYNAGACDGGSSSVLAYDGEILNKPSTNMPTGRYLPNAWLVKRK